METSVSKIDVRRLAAQVSAEHGIRVDPDDPMMAAVTLNKLVLEQAATELMNRIQDVTNRFESAAERGQVRAGHVLAREVRECGDAMKRQVSVAFDNLRGASADGPRVAGTQRWFALGLTMAAFLLGAGIWLGYLFGAASLRR